MKIYKITDSHKYNDIWRVESILDTIVSYVDSKNLTQFNVVNKQIHNLTNPVFHRRLKILHYNDVRKKSYNGSTEAERAEAEINEFIKYNSKHSHLVKEITLSINMKSIKTIEFFTTFKFLTKLDINEARMTQGQFIRMIKPLTQLQVLKTRNTWITERSKSLIKKGDIHLPSTLTKLVINRLYYYDNPALFIKFINSHNSLIEFKFVAGNFSDILGSFQKNYSSLKKFDYSNTKLKNDEDLLNFIKLNTQLQSLYLELDCLNEKFAEYINQYLVNLDELYLRKLRQFSQDNPALTLKFNFPTMIKKLKLNCEDLNEASLKSILVNCPYLRELEVHLPCEWKFWSRLISTKCVSLKKLTIIPSLAVYEDDKVSFSQKFYNSDFIIYKSTLASTLTHFNLYYYGFMNSKVEYFSAFKNLKFVKFAQIRENYYKTDTWPGYSMKRSLVNYEIDIELTKFQYNN